MHVSTEGQSELSVLQCSRRSFTLRTLSLMAASAPLSFSLPLAASASAAPTVADIEIAVLGDWLMQEEPALAAELLAAAREKIGLAKAQAVDWSVAQRARVLLTEHSRVTAELARGDVVYLDGWLLTRSEAGTALLYTEAKSLMESQAGLAR